MSAKRRVLLVDDEVAFTRLVKLNLELGGVYEVQVEQHGAQGFAAAQAFQPEVILLDVIMPDMDGPTVAKQLAADERLKSVPIVFLTATVMKRGVSVPPPDLVGHPVIPKPVSMSELRACLERLLPT
jgi:CheY-like chemotaxis protein